MDCDELRDDQWERLKALVPGGAKASGVREQTTAGFSTLCFGWRARADDGVTCLHGLGLPYGQATLLSLDRDGRS
jgi:hypothetical protein